MSTTEEMQTRAKDELRKTNEGTSDMEEEDDDLRAKIFPQRLMEILSDERNADAITWLPHGRAFIIRSRKLFAEKVMPKFFSRKSKYSSFTRKLNRWNFVRISSGPELGAYYHEFFLRDKPHLAAQMFCKNARAKLAMTTVESHAPSEEQSAPPTKSAPMPSAPGSQPMVPSINALALQKLAFEEQLKKEHAVKEQLAKLQLLEHMGLYQQQPKVDQAKRLMLEAMIAGNSCAPLMQQATSPQMLQAQMVLQQQAQAARLMQMQEIIAMRRKRQGSDAGSPRNHRASAA